MWGPPAKPSPLTTTPSPCWQSWTSFPRFCWSVSENAKPTFRHCYSCPPLPYDKLCMMYCIHPLKPYSCKSYKSGKVMPHYLWIEFRKIFWGHDPWRTLLLEGAVEFFNGRFIFPRALTDLSDKIGLVWTRQLVAHTAPLRTDLESGQVCYAVGKRLVWSCERFMTHKNQMRILCRTDQAENTGLPSETFSLRKF